MLNLPNLRKNQDGSVLVAVFILTLAFTIISLSLSEFSLSHFRNVRRSLLAANALSTAEAGADLTLLKLNQDSNYTPPAGETELYNTDAKGKATYEVSIDPGSISGEKIITSTGRLYFPASSSTPTVTRKVKVVAVQSDENYSYSVQTGAGGLYMSNSATIANGKVYVNGFIDMQNSAKIGTESQPGEVSAADISCPTTGGASYPQICDSSHKSITIINTAHIYADVHKKNQVDSDSITGTIDDTAEPISLPEDNRDTIKTDIQNTGTTMTNDDASCSGSETRTWGNLHITGGDVSINNNCQVTVTGDVWIDGSLEINNNGEIIVDDSLTDAPTIMVDGEEVSLNNQSKILANSSGVAFKIINFYCGSSCSPDSSPTGDELFQATSNVTIDIGNASAASGSVLYARWGTAKLSNGGAVGSLVGQRVDLQNTGNITFGAQLGGGSGGVFTVKFYQQVF